MRELHDRYKNTCRECVSERMSFVGRKGRETHGMKHTRFYKIWENMKARCGNSKHNSFKRYGGRGILVCKRWLKFENFKKDMHDLYQAHSLQHGEKNTTIDRIDGNKGYSPKNCRWATYRVQRINSNDVELFNGETMRSASEKLGGKTELVRGRVMLG